MCEPSDTGKMPSMASKFAIDIAQTESNLANADEAGAAQHSATGQALRPGGYMMALVGAMDATDAAQQAAATARSTTNAATRQFSIATVQTAEDANASVLTA
ncbi:hypothetical protein AWC14_25045 [Mycobacterium kyorinense]|uniref:PE domain-containing protein n=2 Tax=Mycobacterium kyorinense TaxID=487514 RepID=A0A1X1Y819_9MYCO|nr:hypothetical protein AWC14_25045 [Mycobacterium kyorinense]